MGGVLNPFPKVYNKRLRMTLGTMHNIIIQKNICGLCEGFDHLDKARGTFLTSKSMNLSLSLGCPLGDFLNKRVTAYRQDPQEFMWFMVGILTILNITSKLNRGGDEARGALLSC